MNTLVFVILIIFACLFVVGMAANIYFRLMTRYYNRESKRLSAEIAAMNEETATLEREREVRDEYLAKLDVLLRTCKELRFRLESYPDEFEYLIENAEPFKVKVRQESYQMKLAAESGNMKEAKACHIRGLAACEQYEALMSSVMQKKEDWIADIERYKQIFKELEELNI